MSKKAQHRRRARQAMTDTQRLRTFDRTPLAARIQRNPGSAYTQVQVRAVLEILSEGRTGDKAEEIGGNAGQALAWNVGQVLQSLPESPACRAGCAWCCSIPVSVLPPEVLVIAKYLRETLSVEALAAVRDRLRTQAATIAAMTTDAHAEANLPCALLVDGRCSIYPVRPLHCQGWTSLDARACEAGAADPWQQTVRVVLPVLDMAQQAVDGMKVALNMAGLEAPSVELHSALSCALETPDAAAQWVQGRRVFARCTPAKRGVKPARAALLTGTRN